MQSILATCQPRADILKLLEDYFQKGKRCGFRFRNFLGDFHANVACVRNRGDEKS